MSNKILVFSCFVALFSCKTTTNKGSEAKASDRLNEGILWDYPFYCRTSYEDQEALFDSVLDTDSEDTQWKSTAIKVTGADTNERHYSLDYTHPDTGVTIVAKAISRTDPTESGGVHYSGAVEKLEVTTPDGKSAVAKIEDATFKTRFKAKAQIFDTKVKTSEGTASLVEVVCGFYVATDEQPSGD